MQWEWLVIELTVLGLLVTELVMVRREQRRDARRAARPRGDESPES